MKDAVDKLYRVRLILDNLPVTRLSVDRFFELIKEYGESAIFDTVDKLLSKDCRGLLLSLGRLVRWEILRIECRHAQVRRIMMAKAKMRHHGLRGR